MDFLLVNRFFGGSSTPTGRMLYDLAHELVRRGARVTVLTSSGRYAPGEEEAKNEEEGPIQILVTRGGSRGPQVWRWLTFWIQSCFHLITHPWGRLVILTDPPFMGLGAWIAKRLFRRKGRVYWWTMDLYPEALVAAGLIRPKGAVERILRHANELGFSACDGVIALGDRQLERLHAYQAWKEVSARGSSQEGSPVDSHRSFAVVVPPWDRRTLAPVPDLDNDLLQSAGWKEKKVVLYAGNLGRGHSFHELLAAARFLEDKPDSRWHFVFVVRGAKRAALEEAACGMANVEVLDYVDPDRVSQLFSAAAIQCISMERGWDGIIVPSKLYGALKFKAPLLFIGPEESETAKEIRNLRAGAVLRNDCEPRELIQTIEELVCLQGPPEFQCPEAAHTVASFVMGH